MTSYGIRLVGNEETDTFPWAVISPSGGIVNRFTHRAVADQIADRLNMRDAGYPYEVDDEVAEHMPTHPH
jgi:hypothetical protein